MAQLQHEQAEQFANTFARVRDEVKRDILTPESADGDFVTELLTAVFAGGHVLLEGLPGLGKTMLVRAIGRALGLRFGRIQFTPDLMPADITGTQVLQPDEHGRLNSEFKAGPAFANVLLADEINRASPKTQSALLEMMGERQITVGGITYRPGQNYLSPQWDVTQPGLFHVLATQNPIEQEGTYPLPEAQLDRFFFKLNIPFPDAPLLHRIVDMTTRETEAEEHDYTPPSFNDMLALQNLPRHVEVTETAIVSAVLLTQALNPKAVAGNKEPRAELADTEQYCLCGPSPRGTQTLIMAAKTRALIDGRPNIDADDIRASAKPALRHRLALNHRAFADGMQADDLIETALQHLSL